MCHYRNILSSMLIKPIVTSVTLWFQYGFVIACLPYNLFLWRWLIHYWDRWQVCREPGIKSLQYSISAKATLYCIKYNSNPLWPSDTAIALAWETRMNTEWLVAWWHQAITWSSIELLTTWPVRKASARFESKYIKIISRDCIWKCRPQHVV